MEYFKNLLLSLFILSSFGCSDKIQNDINNLELGNIPLVLISIDGFGWDYFDKADTPNLDKIINRGVKAEGLKTVYPSKTFPNHISIVTGNYPDNHGIISNYFYDAEFDEYFYIGAGSTATQDGKWIQAEPIWVTVEKQLKKAMIMFWPMSDAEIMGYRPSEYYVYSGTPSNTDRMQQLLDWLDYTEEKRPSFLASYFSIVDSIGHQYGPDSQEVVDAIIEVDNAIGYFIDGLESRGILDDIHLIIVSDHGMVNTPTSQFINITNYVNLENVVSVGRGEFIEFRPEPNKINELYQNLQNIPNTRVFKKEDMINKFNYGTNDRIEPIVLMADEGWLLYPYDRTSPRPGSHGFDPNFRSMNGIFIGMGPNLKSGYTGPTVQNIHLYEMMCYLMGIVPVENDGSINEIQNFLKR